MAEYPKNLKYTKEHEWARKDGKSLVVVGITSHAQEELGDVVYVELPKVGSSITAGVPFGVIESTKGSVQGRMVDRGRAERRAPGRPVDGCLRLREAGPGKAGVSGRP